MNPSRRSRPRSSTTGATLKASKSNPCRASAARRSSAAAAGLSRSRFAAVLMTPKPLMLAVPRRVGAASACEPSSRSASSQMSVVTTAGVGSTTSR